MSQILRGPSYLLDICIFYLTANYFLISIIILVLGISVIVHQITKEETTSLADQG